MSTENIVCRYRLPNFVVIGAQKSATTFLLDVLRENQGVFMHEHEIHYFNRDIYPAEKYLDIFKGRTEEIVGEKTPAYFHMSDERIRIMKSIIPDAKLILLLRDPIDRGWSHARMEVSNYGQRDLSRTDVWRLVAHLANARNRMRSNYAKSIKRWLKYYNRDQLMIAYYDDLLEDADSLYGRICSFIGAKPGDERKLLAKKVHASRTYQMPLVIKQYLIRKYTSTCKELKDLDIIVPVKWNEVRHERPRKSNFISKYLILFFLGIYEFIYLVSYSLYLNYKSYRDLKRKRSVINRFKQLIGE